MSPDLRSGWTKESEVADLIKARHFRTIEVDVPDLQIAQPTEEIDGERFTPAIMNELRENFRVLAAHQSIPRSPRKTPVEFGEFRPSLFPSFSSGYTSNGC